MDGADAASPPADRSTLRQQWIVIAVFSAFIMLCLGMEAWDYPTELEQGKRTPYEFLVIVLNSIGCALWIAMDRKRRGLEVGKWRICAVFFGPAAVCIYIIGEYKGRAVYLLPIVVAIYLALGFLPYGAVFLIQRFWI
jgi:hypothetical protein